MIGPKRALLVAALTGLAAAAPFADAEGQAALEIRIAPAEYLIANEARVTGLGYEGTSPYYDLVLQTILFINRGDGPLTIEGGSIALLREGAVLQQTAISTAELVRAQRMAAAIAKMGFQAGLDVQYSAGSLLPDGISLAPSLTLAAGTAGLVDDYYLVARSLPDKVRVTASARNAAGELVTGETTLPVRSYEPKNSYLFPLEAGDWFVVSFPGLKGHHRWTAATEHGIDITMVDSRGSWARGEADAWRTGRVPRWEDWYAYGKQVLAAADGVVIKVVDDVEFPLAFWNRRDGESVADYRRRIGQRQMELFMAPGADPPTVAGGNHIVIRHAGGEHSFYAHLAYGSIRVKEGQQVVQGQPIAGVGGTGEVPAVHLHFQVSDGPSMRTSRTVPVRFSNVHVNEQSSDSFEPRLVFQSGFFVKADPPSAGGR